MPINTNTTSLRNASLSKVLLKVADLSNEYINKGQNLIEKGERKKELASSLLKYAQGIEDANCPPGTFWDPISGTCKPR
jgi:hypothetical protein